jgi:hypothetical protein
VIDRVAHPGEREHRDQHRKRIDHPDHRKGDRADRQAGGQHVAGADPVDQESGRRLQGARHQIIGGERDPELRIGDAVVGAHESEQRGEDERVVVADEMRRAHRRDHARFYSRVAYPRVADGLICAPDWGDVRRVGHGRNDFPGFAGRNMARTDPPR